MQKAKSKRLHVPYMAGLVLHGYFQRKLGCYKLLRCWSASRVSAALSSRRRCAKFGRVPEQGVAERRRALPVCVMQLGRARKLLPARHSGASAASKNVILFRCA